MKAKRHRKNGDSWRRTFREVIDKCREAAARRAWERARTASELRHWSREAGTRSAVRLLGRIKHAAISRACELAPEQIRVTIDTDFHVGLLSIRFNGSGRLHLPAVAEFQATSVEQLPAKRVA